MTPERSQQLPLVLLSLVLTLVLFLLVDAERRDVHTLVLPVELPPLSDDQMVLTTLPEVNVTVEGRRNVLRRWQGDEVTPLKLRNVEEGEHEYPLRDADLRLPPGVTLRAIVPTSVRISIETRQTRSVPVRANLRGAPPEGFEVGDVSVTPANARISGPLSSLDGLDTVFTQTVSLAGQRESFSRDVDLSLHRPFLSHASGESFRVYIEITSEQTERTFEGVPVEKIGPDLEAVTVEPPSVRIRVSGPRAVVESMDPDVLFVAVTAERLPRRTPGLHLVEPDIRNLPRGVEVIDLRPESLRVRLPGPGENDAPEEPPGTENPRPTPETSPTGDSP